MSAPGWVGPDIYPDGEPSGDYWTHCNVGICPWVDEACLTLAAAADALREHLRTEHADLFEKCGRCGGDGGWLGGNPDWPTTCPDCHGRGWTMTNGDDR